MLNREATIICPAARRDAANTAIFELDRRFGPEFFSVPIENQSNKTTHYIASTVCSDEHLKELSKIPGVTIRTWSRIPHSKWAGKNLSLAGDVKVEKVDAKQLMKSKKLHRKKEVGGLPAEKPEKKPGKGLDKAT